MHGYSKCNRISQLEIVRTLHTLYQRNSNKYTNMCFIYHFQVFKIAKSTSKAS